MATFSDSTENQVVYDDGEMSSDLVAVWEVPMHNGVHTIEFEHGTLTGKRIIRIDGKEITKKEWMFKLVGEETFRIGNARGVIKIDPHGLFNYIYSLSIDGKTLKKFTENQSKICNTWLVSLPPDGVFRVVLQKDTLDVWANGSLLEVESTFVDNGTEMHFLLGQTPAYIKSMPSYTKKEGIIYSLIVNEDVIDPTN